MTWPELDISVECAPLGKNTEVLDWWLDRGPVKAIQSHAAVSGEVMYVLNARLPDRLPWTTVHATQVEVPMTDSVTVGLVSLSFVVTGGQSAGQIGSIIVDYGPITEEMSLSVFGDFPVARVVEADQEKIKYVGRRVWEGIYKTKEVFTVVLTEKEG